MNEAVRKSVLSFAGLLLDGGRGCLRGPDGAEIPLAPKPFDLLMVLARNAGRTMGKDALLYTVWPGVHVTEDSLFRAVREARLAIGDEAGRVLRSVPRRGYLLDAAVAAETAPHVAAEPRLPSTPAPIPAVLAPPADTPSLVVLPFVNMSADPEQDYFVDGLVDDITTALACIRSFFVIARSSAFTYKGRAVDVRQVGRELGVGYVLEGSVRKAVGRIRVTGQLVDATTGAQVWADRFDGALDDVFALQDRVTEAVAGAIEPRLQRAEIERAQRKPTQDLNAHDLFLRGMAAFQHVTPERTREAQALFLQAARLHPGYGAAHGMAAFCVTFQKSLGVLPPSAPELDEGLRWARQAAETGADDATALWTAGMTLTYVGMDPEAGILLLDRACTINPNSARAWSRAAATRNYLGEPLTAIAHYERAFRLSPQDPNRFIDLNGMGFAKLQAGAHDEAVAWGRRSVAEKSGWAMSQRNLAAALALSGQIDEARRAMAEMMRLAPSLRLTAIDYLTGPLRNRDFAARFTDALRLAGMPK